MMKVRTEELYAQGWLRPFVFDPPTLVTPEDVIVLRVPLQDESIAEIHRVDGSVLRRKVVFPAEVETN